MSRDANVGVHTEARSAGTTWIASDGKISQIDPVPNLPYPVGSARAGGNASGDRSAVEFGEQRLVVMERVGFVPIGLRPQTAAFKEPGDTALNALGHTGHFGIAGREHGPENDLASLFGHVNAVQRQRMEMEVEIQGIAKALHERYGAAPGPPYRYGRGGGSVGGAGRWTFPGILRVRCRVGPGCWRTLEESGLDGKPRRGKSHDGAGRRIVSSESTAS
jgi:hypothetical protein